MSKKTKRKEFVLNVVDKNKIINKNMKKQFNNSVFNFRVISYSSSAFAVV